MGAMMGKGFLVLGTDTGVGKTVVTAGLVRALVQKGVSAVAMKPVVSGGEFFYLTGSQEGVFWQDLETLNIADYGALSQDERSPYRFMMPASPHFASLAEGRMVSEEVLVQGVHQQLSRQEVVLIEGVGGLRVPLKPDGYDLRDLAVKLGLPVILVVGFRLGCINHALLTMESLNAKGIKVVEWVANMGLDATYQNKAETLQFLEDQLGLACAISLPSLEPCLGANLPSQENYFSFDDFKGALEGVVHASSLATQGLADRLAGI